MADSDKLPVLVAIHTSAKDDRGEQVEDMRMVTSGTVSTHPDGSCLLHYTETMTDEDSGETMSAQVRLKIQPDRVIMQRTGPYGTTMVFARGQRFEGTYHTPYGDMAMALYTTRLVTSIAPGHSRLALEYQLDMNGAFAAVRKMSIDFGAEDRRTT